MGRMNEEYFSSLERYINSYNAKSGSSPTVIEIAAATGIPRSTVSRYLRYMNEHGMLDYKGYRKISTEKTRKMKKESVMVPILGSIACGIPKFAEENIEEYVRLPESLFGSGEFFILKADGESMKDAGIQSGDLVLIRQQNYANPGQIIVALVDDETATLKRYRPRADEHCIDLIPENKEFKVQTIDLREQTFAIQGVAVKVIKGLE